MASYISDFLQSRRGLLSSFSNPILSSYAGLFWFKDDYSDITETKGEVKFDSRDIVSEQTIIPDGTHASFKGRRFDTPRGRVELNNGVVTVSVGEQCPDSAIDLVVKVMGLDRYKDSIQIRRNSFWDKK